MNKNRLFFISVISMVLFFYMICSSCCGQDFSNDTISVEPDNDDIFKHGNLLIRQGKYDEAEQIYLELIKNDPDNYSAHVNLGSVYFGKDVIDKAINEYEISIRLNPEKPQAFFNMGLLCSSLHDYEKALNFFKKADEVDPDNRATLFSIGETYFNLKNYDAAMEWFLKVWHYAPESEQNLYKIADIYQIKGDYKLEAAVYKQILIRRKSFYGYFRLGIALNKLNDRQGEIDAYKNALAISPDETDVIYNLALAYRAENRLDEALELFDKLIVNRADPDEDALYYASIICAQTNNIYKAWEYYEILNGINPEKAEEIYNILKNQ